MVLKLPRKKAPPTGLPSKVDMTKLRRCEHLVKGFWEEIPFGDLRRGDVFRLFEPDGTPVDNGEVTLCIEDAYYTSETKTWGTKTAPFDRELLIGRKFTLPTEEGDAAVEVGE